MPCEDPTMILIIVGSFARTGATEPSVKRSHSRGHPDRSTRATDFGAHQQRIHRHPPDTEAAGAVILAEKIRASIAESAQPVVGQITINLNIGVPKSPLPTLAQAAPYATPTRPRIAPGQKNATASCWGTIHSLPEHRSGQGIHEPICWYAASASSPILVLSISPERA